MTDPEDRAFAIDLWVDSQADLLRPTGCEDPDAVARALWLSDLQVVPLADPAPVGLTEDERRNVEWIRRWCAPTSEHLGTLLAIIDRLSAAPPVVPEPSCRHAVYHHGCPSCDRQDPEERL